ncbi:MAG: Yip1 family protein [Spirochaetota bacterium]
MNKDYIRSLRWVDYVYFALVDPRGLCKLINASGSGFLSVLIIIPVLAALSQIVALSLLSVQSRFFFSKLSYGWVLLSLLNLACVLLISLLVDMGLQFAGKPGNIKKILSLLLAAQFPKVLLLPAVSVFSVISFAPVVFYVLFSIAFFLWCVYIAVTGISEMHALPFGKALAFFAVPYLAIAVLLLFIAVSGSALAVSALNFL